MEHLPLALAAPADHTIVDVGKLARGAIPETVCDHPMQVLSRVTSHR